MFVQKRISRRYKLSTIRFAVALLMFAASGLALSVAEAGENDSGSAEPRSSTSLQRSEGEAAASATKSTDSFQPLVTEGKRPPIAAQQKIGESASATNSLQSFDFWIYSADVDLFHDDDWDGFYHGIDLRFDADTWYAAAEVYAVLFLSYEGGPWNEYAVTNIFTIWGSSGLDDYFIETELLSGYPTGYYDLLIELYDAWDGSYVASFGPADSSELSFLPLESANRDDSFIGGGGTTISRGGGGAISWLLLAMLPLLRAHMTVTAARIRMRRRRRD